MCALFYDYKVNLPSGQRTLCAAWGEVESMLAIGLDSHEVQFFSDEGDKIPGMNAHSRGATIMTMSWQPRGHFLAIGWSDGMVSLYVANESISREVNSPHSSPICLLKWAPSGNRLLSADERGLLVVWKIDSRAQLLVGAQYARHGSITHCVFTADTNKNQTKALKTDFHTCPSFFFGGEVGSVHYADDLGHISDIQVLQHAIDSMMYYEETNQLIIFTRALLFYIFQVDTTENKVNFVHKIKLSVAGEGSIRETKWAGPGLLAIATGEPLVRFWDLQHDDNSILTLPKYGGAEKTQYLVSSIDFSPHNRLLAAGTAQGSIFLWKCTSLVTTGIKLPKKGAQTNMSIQKLSVSVSWNLIFAGKSTEQTISSVQWSPLHSMVFAHTSEGVIAFHEGVMHRNLCGDLAIIQTTPTTLSIEKIGDGEIVQSTLTSGLRIKGIALDNASIVLWNGSKAEVQEISNNEAKMASQFKCSSTAMIIRGDSIYRAAGNHVEVCNFQGIVKNTLSFTDVEGKPQTMAVQNKFLAVATDVGFIRVFDLSRREPKPVGIGGRFENAIVSKESNTAVVQCMSVNSDGTRVIFTADQMEGSLQMRVPMNKLFLYQTDLNIFQSYDFGDGRYPTSVFFDPNEPRLFASEIQKKSLDNQNLNPSPINDSLKDDGAIGLEEIEDSKSNISALQGPNVAAEKEIAVFFASNDHGILLQDMFDLDAKYAALLGIQVPRIYLVAHEDNLSGQISAMKMDPKEREQPGRRASGTSVKASGKFSYLRTIIMRDFIGLDKVNDTARQALIDFCYFMTIGNMDEAYRSVKLIENSSVWENMARMCVKTKRLDVAEVCLGHMGHARGAAAVQLAKKEPEVEAAIAMVAIQLGLRDDAARLYRECGRYDLLNKLYQASGYWQKSIDTATKRDRIHLKNASYALARNNESIGKIKEAMALYEDAGTHRKDIPRMLFKLNKLDVLEKYIKASKDKEMIIWWAQFQESQGKMDIAIELYEQAEDFLSIVRVLCFKKEYAKAAKLVTNTRNKAAAYHLARQFEIADDISTAIHFFAMGECYGHAIRLAKENHMDGELVKYAFHSSPTDMLEVAKYFEDRNDLAKAVQLYQKGGNMGKAIDLCFQAQLFDELQHITDEICANDPKTASPVLLRKCAEFFLMHKQFEKSVALCLIGNRPADALEICLQHNVLVTEDMAEKMTPPKDDKDSKQAAKARTMLLLKLAKCCKHQGSYHLATKKYTQAGDKLKAMKCLLKSGDTEKVIFFANVSRNNDIYILAGNYLQTLDWRAQPDILKSIITFYSKARACDQLCRFYQSCAQAEIEEYQDYNKAVDALQEALKVMKKGGQGNDAKTTSKSETAVLERKIALIHQYLEAKQQVLQRASNSIPKVQALLEERDLDTNVSIGDVYSLLTQAYALEDKWLDCRNVMDKMSQLGLQPKKYIDPQILYKIQAQVGHTVYQSEEKVSTHNESKLNNYTSEQKAYSHEDEQDMEEDIIEED